MHVLPSEHSIRSIARALAVALLALHGSAVHAWAQTYSADARSIALGGSSSAQNIAVSLIDSPRPYGRVVIPLGLLQVLGDLGAFDPSSDDYDPVLALDYAANPLHYTFGRGDDGPGRRFFRDLAHGELSRDLLDYQGFTPPTEVRTEGLAYPSFGRTFPVVRAGGFHGIYVGVGPYVAARTDGFVDPALVEIVGSGTAALLPDRTFRMTSGATSQLAIGATLGYRGRIALPGLESPRAGIYLGGNVHYLHGLWLDDFAVDMRIATGTDGLVTPTSLDVPVSIDRVTSTSGRGTAIDLGTAVVAGPWQVGFGANGIGNRIRWRGLERERYLLTTVVGGGDYVDVPGDAEGEREIRLPVDYITDVGYHGRSWSAVVELGRGLMGSRFHAGVERRFRWIELRAGARRSREIWHPAVGVGFNSARNLGLDLAIFTLASSLDTRRQTAFAVSLRFAGTSR